MSKQAGTAPLARSREARAGRELLWNKAIQIARDPHFVTVCLWSIVGLLVSLFLAVLFELPAADTLLDMPW